MSLASQDGGYFYFKVLDSYRGSRDKGNLNSKQLTKWI